jgi:lactoylglutathione lyase
MFEKNMLTFNPGWGQQRPEPADVHGHPRTATAQLKAQGMQFVAEADESTTGPASLIAVDPDGNRCSSIRTGEA